MKKITTRRMLALTLALALLAGFAPVMSSASAAEATATIKLNKLPYDFDVVTNEYHITVTAAQASALAPTLPSFGYLGTPTDRVTPTGLYVELPSYKGTHLALPVSLVRGLAGGVIYLEIPDTMIATLYIGQALVDSLSADTKTVTFSFTDYQPANKIGVPAAITVYLTQDSDKPLAYADGRHTPTLLFMQPQPITPLIRGDKDGINMPRCWLTSNNWPAAVMTGNGTYAFHESLNTEFSDVPDWAVVYTDTLSTLGVVQGIGNGLFGAGRTVTRADFITMLMRIYGPVDTADTPQFSDVAPTAYYADAVRQARKMGIVVGFGGNTFKPTAPITRQELATMCQRALDAFKVCYQTADSQAKTLDQFFSDAADINSYAQMAMLTLAVNQILAGSNGRARPNANATRAEAAAIMTRMLKLDHNVTQIVGG